MLSLIGTFIYITLFSSFTFDYLQLQPDFSSLNLGPISTFRLTYCSSKKPENSIRPYYYPLLSMREFSTQQSLNEPPFVTVPCP